MARDKEKKGRKKMKKNLRDKLDDNDREQVEPRLEPSDAENQDERWAQPGDDTKPEADLPRLTNVRE